MRSNKLRIVIDPGHGGQATGAVGPQGTLEKDLNLTLGLLLKEFLWEAFEVSLTREEDVNPTLQERVKFAEDQNADIFICTHFNADSLGRNINQTEIYVPFEETGPSWDFAIILREKFLKYFDIPCKNPVPSRYTVLGGSVPVKVLLEVSYLTSHEEEEKLKNRARLETVAKILKEALLEFTQKPISRYERYVLWENEIRFKFNKDLDPAQLLVRVDGEEFRNYYVKKNQVVAFIESIGGGEHTFELLGKALDGTSIPHVREKITLQREPYYFVASIYPYTGQQLLKIKVFDRFMTPVPAGIPMSIDAFKVSYRGRKRGFEEEQRGESYIKHKRTVSDEKGTYALLIKGLTDEAQVIFSVESFSGKVVVENIARRKSNISGYVYNVLTSEPLRGVRVLSESGVDFTEEFGIFEIERHSEAEMEKVFFHKDGFYPKEMDIGAGSFVEVFLEPVYNGVLLGKKVLLDFDNFDLYDSSVSFRSWETLNYLERLIRFAGGEVFKTRLTPFQEVDDYTKVKRALELGIDVALQISNSKLGIPGVFHALYYERSDESKLLAESIKAVNLYKGEEPVKTRPYGNYFIIQLPGPRVYINFQGLFEAGYLKEDEIPKYVALRLFVGLLSFFGFKGVYTREYQVSQEFDGVEVVSEDFPLSFEKGGNVVLLFSRPDSKIVIKKGDEVLFKLDKPMEGTCIIWPDGN